MPQTPPLNRGGLINEEPSPLSWRTGAETGIPYEVVVESGDWRPYDPYAESQDTENVKSMACTSFSYLRVVLPQLQLRYDSGKMSAAHRAFLERNGYFDKETGKLNCSEKYLAILSGTTENGNTFENVARTGKNFGIVPQAMVPQPGTEKDLAEWIDPKQISAEARALGLEFLRYFQLPYELVFYDNDPGLPDYVVTALEYAIRQSPLQIAIPRPGTHAVVAARFRAGRDYTIFDSYPPYVYDVRWPKDGRGEDIHYSMKIVPIEKMVPTVPAPVPATAIAWDTFTRPLSVGMSGNDVRLAQQLLKRVGFFNAEPTGNFLTVTRASVVAFQKAYGVIATGNFWTLTIAAMKEAIAGRKVTSDAGKNLIKSFEGLHDGNPATSMLEPQLDPAGLPTIGWGARYDAAGAVVTMRTKAITLDQAEELFVRDLRRFEDTVQKVIKATLSGDQFDALVSFAYNIGTAGFAASSVAAKVNAGTVKRQDFLDYSKARVNGVLKSLPGLVKRRGLEADLFGLKA